MDAIAPPVPVGLSGLLGSGLATLQSGQMTEALVLAVLDDGTARLQLPTMVVDVRSSAPLVAGTTVPIAVRGSGAAMRLTIVTASGAPAEAKVIAAATSAPPSRPASVPEPPASATTMAASPDNASARAQALVTVSIGSAEESDATVAAPENAATVAPRPSVAPPAGFPQAVESAASRQGGLAPLLANLEQVTADPSLPVPPQVRQAAAAVLSLRVAFDGNLNADDLRQGLVRSGLFLEARLAAATDAPSSDSPSLAGTQTQAPADLKVALLMLRQAVRSWLGDATATAPNNPGRLNTTAWPAGAPDRPANPGSLSPGGAATPGSAAASAPLPEAHPTDVGLALADAVPPQPAETSVPAPADDNAVAARSGPALPDPPANGSDRAPPPSPPYRGGPTRAQGVAARTIPDAASSRDIAAHLLDQTEAALSRHVLLQVASLPDHGEGGHRAEEGPHWAFEIPLATSQGTGIAQFEVARDGRAPTPDQQTVWRARFSVNVEPMGPIHAQLTLLGDRAAVTLWAERDASMARLREGADVLAQALRDADLEPGDIRVRSGAPAMPRPAAGQFLDRAS